jgi:hypothetical protein
MCHKKGAYAQEKVRQATYATFDNDQCQKCHRNLLHMPTQRGAMLAHRSMVNARPGYEKKCRFVIDESKVKACLTHSQRPTHADQISNFQFSFLSSCQTEKSAL